MKLHVFGIALLSVTAVVADAPAQAQNGTLTRSFVSSAGVDTNPCTIAQPCATFAKAYTAVGANGIIAALDPGKYGPIIITSPVTVNGNGWAAITGPSGGDAITINGASGNVTLIGLELDGAGVGTQGIILTSTLSGNATLNIRDCIVSNFIDSGIAIQPTSGGYLNVFIANTFSLNNGLSGIKVAPGANAGAVGTITGSTVANNADQGFDFEGSIAITLLNSVATTNNSYGIQVNMSSSPTSSLTVRDTVAVENNALDFYVVGPGITYLYHNTLGGFGASGSTVYSDGTNDIQSLATSPPTKQSTY
jgi:hypothetical protein